MPFNPNNLVEIDSLSVVVIIGNEIDIMSTTPANTVRNNGRMPNLSLSQSLNLKPFKLEGR